jgi:hypothetical protein
MHLVMLGFIPILDFLHLLVYLYGAACALEGKGSAAAWALYESWLMQAWPMPPALEGGGRCQGRADSPGRQRTPGRGSRDKMTSW